MNIGCWVWASVSLPHVCCVVSDHDTGTQEWTIEPFLQPYPHPLFRRLHYVYYIVIFNVKFLILQDLFNKRDTVSNQTIALLTVVSSAQTLGGV